jgi:hypothetical protein
MMQLVFLWGVPRSVSTAFEKAVSRHPEIAISHEPFTNSYYFGGKRRSDRYIRDNAGKSYPSVSENPLRGIISDKQVVFIKELAFQGEPYVSDDILASSKHLLIARKPEICYSSLIKLKPDFTEDEFGFAALERIVNRLSVIGCQPLMNIDGDKFRQHPDKILRETCKSIEIDFDLCMLNWPSGKIREWGDDEAQSQKPWHKTLERSNAVLPPVITDVVAIRPEHLEIVHRATSIYERHFG